MGENDRWNQPRTTDNPYLRFPQTKLVCFGISHLGRGIWRGKAYVEHLDFES